MSDSTAKKLTELAKEFMAGLRQHLADSADPEVLVERVFAALAAVTAGVIMLLPIKGKEKLIAALLATAIRYFTTKPRHAHAEEVPA